MKTMKAIRKYEYDFFSQRKKALLLQLSVIKEKTKLPCLGPAYIMWGTKYYDSDS
jgi:hypothetical protein